MINFNWLFWRNRRVRQLRETVRSQALQIHELKKANQQLEKEKVHLTHDAAAIQFQFDHANFKLLRSKQGNQLKRLRRENAVLQRDLTAAIQAIPKQEHLIDDLYRKIETYKKVARTAMRVYRSERTAFDEYRTPRTDKPAPV